jgi:hypothetical protein
MPTASEITDPHLSIYVPSPAAGPGVCAGCHGATGSGWVRCWSCNTSRQGVQHPLELIVPISLTRTDLDAQLYNVLRDYKNASDPRVSGVHRQHIAAILLRFLGRHRTCIERAAGGAYDTITVVPSKRRAPDALHPLELAVALAEPLQQQHERLLLPGPESIRRNTPSDRAYVATDAARGRNVLLLDDTLTSSASLQSAASALTLGGATVVAGVVVGRVIDVSNDNYPEKRALWERQAGQPFTFDRCCLED